MTLYPVPDLSVEISFDPPDAASPTWVDVSDRVRTTAPVTMTRGRSDERSDSAQPGSCSLTLDNADGYFTPGATASPYYPDIVPWRRIRVSLSTPWTVALFYGFITQWALTWEAPAAPVVKLQCLDSLQLLSRRQLLSTLDEHIAYDSTSLVAHWSLDGTTLRDTVAGLALRAEPKSGVGEIKQGEDGGPAGGVGAATTFDFTGGGVAPTLHQTGFTCDTYGAVAFWFATTGTYVPLVSLTAPPATPVYGPGFSTMVEADGTLRTLVWATDGSTTTADTTGTYNDGAVHAVAVVWDASSTQVYVDGTLAASAAATPKRFHDAVLRIGPASIYANPVTAGSVTIGHVAVYSNASAAAFDSTRAAAHAAAGTGFAGESTFDRLAHWCEWVGVTLTNGGSGEGATLSAIQTAGRTAGECAQDALRTDYGAILAASLSDRELTFYDRTNRYETTPSITLDCATDQVDDDLQVLSDPTYVASVVTVTTPSAVFTSRNAATEAIYGVLGMDVQADPSDDHYATSLAEALGAISASPTPRIPTVTTDLLTMARDSTIYDPTAIPELALAVSLTNLPDTAPAGQMDAFVEGITETVGGAQWSRTASLSPGYPWLDVWTIEDTVLGYIEGATPNVIAL